MTRAAEPADRALAAAALEKLGGACLLLDAQLRVRVATAAASALLGFEAPIGTSAATLLCGDRAKRPFAEALALGIPFHAVIPRPRGVAGEQLRVRSLPLGESHPSGWLVFLAAVAAGDLEPVQFHGLWTRDPRMRECFRVIERVAPEDFTVLVRGETGTGKELVAHALHALSDHREGPFRALNCAALPANLLESELFGHVRGAFTGAVKDTPGHIQLAHGGTLFLDEIAELPLELQAKLLRVLETHMVLPVGGREPIPVRVRIVAATHRSLQDEVSAGRFRADLMYRLRVIPIRLPPLRERPADVSLIGEKLIDELNARGRRQITSIEPAAEAALERHPWPGNVRELRNVLAYAFAVGDGPVLRSRDLPPELTAPRPDEREVLVTGTGDAGLEAVGARTPEERRIRDALARTGGNRERAAKLLGLSRATLWRRLRVLGLDVA